MGGQQNYDRAAMARGESDKEEEVTKRATRESQPEL